MQSGYPACNLLGMLLTRDRSYAAGHAAGNPAEVKSQRDPVSFTGLVEVFRRTSRDKILIGMGLVDKVSRSSALLQMDHIMEPGTVVACRNRYSEFGGVVRYSQRSDVGYLMEIEFSPAHSGPTP